MLMAEKKYLFLTLRIFSATGGIEKMCRILGKALSDLTSKTVSGFTIFSLYDTCKTEMDYPYFSNDSYKRFGTNKLKFILASVKRAFKSDVIVLSHINLVSIGWLIKIISPSKKIILIAHGREVWVKLRWHQRLFIGSIDKIVAVSHFTKNNLLSKNKINEEKVIVVNNCIDPFLVKNESSLLASELKLQFNIKPETKVILTLARVAKKDREKGYVRVINSLGRIKNSFPDFIYIIAGSIDLNEKKYVDKILHETGLVDKVIFTGFIKPNYLSALFSLSNVFVMPSTKEGFGVVFLEAMYFGIPVIAGNVGGSADALLNGKLGKLINPNDTDEISEAIIDVFTNEDKYKADNEVLMANFGFEVYKKKFEKFIEAL
jgi:glycosyltransferase involved in cell wall biosynthesis